MSAFVGDPALRELARLKLRGTLRRAGRRFRTPSGAVFALLGIGLALVWIGGLVLTVTFGDARVVPPERALDVARLAVFGLALLTVTGNFAHRGLYLPIQEIERLFSAPLARADVIRYRLQMSLGQSLIGGLFLALLGASRLPTPLAAALGAPILVATFAVAGQGLALALGGLERRIPVSLLRNGARVLMGAMVAALALLFILRDELPDDVRSLGASLPADPRVVALLRPFEPWARMLTAGSPSELLLWGGLCLGILLALFEAVARLPVDFRELALANSADVAARLRRLRQGGVASAGKLRGGEGLKPVPHVFGRGAWGAVAWRKLVGILRRARATLLFSSFMLAVLVLSASAIGSSGGDGAATSGTVMIAMLGTLYMGSGLRFDFREDIERMDRLKSLPLTSTAVFTATLLPEVCLIAGLIVLAVIAHGLIVGADPALTLASCAFVLPFAWIWLALDNAIFLVWPVRVVPGQDGALQNMGRASIFMVLRLVVLAVAVGLAVGLAVAVVALAQGVFDVDPGLATWLGAAAAWVLLVGVAWVVARFGGTALRRFDPAELD